VLKHPSVRQVDLVELDEEVIAFSRTMLGFAVRVPSKIPVPGSIFRTGGAL